MNKKQLNKPKLKLIKSKDSYDGYLIGNIEEVLEPEQFAEFANWISGQTVGIYKGECLVYEHDFVRFLKGLPVLD